MRRGEVLAERYEIEQLAASGGMGSVYRARDRTTGMRVALKRLHGSTADDAQRLAREIRILSALDHPAIVRYLGHGWGSDGAAFLVMEWLDGVSLEHRLSQGVLSIAETIQLGRHVATALGVAHAHGLVHRDIKPGNVFLVGGGVEDVRLLDFGIARSTHASGVVTRTGSLLGTLGYMAPEQARGGHDIDVRSDIFSFGCILFECLTGRPAFGGEAMLAVLMKILFEEPPRSSALRAGIPHALDELVARMLAKSPEQRPQNAEAVARALGELRLDAREDALPQAQVEALTSDELRLVSVVTATLDVAAALLMPAAPEETLPMGSGRHELQRVAEAVAAFGAHVEQLPGGAIVATVAAQGSVSEQAVRAARTALAIRKMLPRGMVTLTTGRGSATGQLPLGELIDRTIGMIQVKEAVAHGPCAIRLDAVTADFLDDRFIVVRTPHGELELQGEREGSGELPASRTLLGKATLCVGRQRELRLLDDYFRECVDESMGRAVLVTGDAGVGKSRLCSEFLRALVPGAEVWIAQATPLCAGSPLGLLGQLMRRTAAVVEGEALALRRGKLRARIEAAGVAAAEVERVTQFLGEAIGTPFEAEASVQLKAARGDAQLMRDQMRQAWHDFLRAECTQRPLLIVLEDLQWGDLPTLQWLDTALRELKEKPLLVLGLARPEIHDRFPKLWVDRGRQEIRLTELSRKASEQLVRQVLGESVGNDTLDRVVRQAGGNAFFLEELIRALSQGNHKALPETVLATVQVRLEALDAESRRVIRAASVFGDTFWQDGLVALLGATRAASTLHGCLRNLTDQELIGPCPESRYPEQSQYRFRHGFVREAAYAMLTEKDRVLGHQLAAEWLANAGEQDEFVLATHFEYGRQLAQAAARYGRSAERALQAGDLAAAIERCERAVACGATGELLGQVRQIQADAYTWRGERETAARVAEEAMRLMPRASLPWLRVAAQAAETAVMRGDHAGAAELIEALAEAIEATPPAPEQLTVVAATIKNLLYLGRVAATERLIRHLEAARHTPIMAEPLLAAIIHDTLSYHAGFVGDPVGGYGYGQAALGQLVQAGALHRVELCGLQTAILAVRLGRYAATEADLRARLERYHRLGLYPLATWAEYILAMIQSRTGAYDEAEQRLAGVIANLQQSGNPAFVARSRCVLAQALLGAGRLDEAHASAHAAAEGGDYAAAQAMVGWVLLERGEVAAALWAAEQAAATLVRVGSSFEDNEALVHLVLAKALDRAGDQPRAREVIRASQAHLLAQAGKLDDAGERRMVLADVAEHAETLALARAWA